MEQDPPELDVTGNIDRLPTQSKLARDYPLHSALYNMSEAGSANTIRATAVSDLASIHTPDFAGNTPLHMAAKDGKIRAVHQLLAISTQDAYVMNNEGLTPLHALQCALLDSREFNRVFYPGIVNNDHNSNSFCI